MNNSLSLKGMFIWLHGEGQGRMEPWHCSVVHRSLFFAMSCLKKNDLSWLPCVHHFKYCKLLCMDLNHNLLFFPYEALVNKKRSAKAVWYTLIQVVLLCWGIAEKSGAEKVTFFTVCALCLVCVDWCRFSEMKCLDDIIQLRYKWKFAFLVCSRCIVNFTVILPI